MKVTEEKLKEWQLLLQERKERGLKVDDFCREKNISVPTFYYYHKVVKKKLVAKNEVTDKGVIKPIKIINGPSKENSTIHFILPNNLQCILPRDTSTLEIKTILELMLSC